MKSVNKNHHTKTIKVIVNPVRQDQLPGSLILQLMFAHGIEFQKDLAAILGLSASTLNKIIKGKLHITADIAIRLASLFSQYTAEEWMAWQASFDLETAKVCGVESRIREEICENKKLYTQSLQNNARVSG